MRLVSRWSWRGMGDMLMGRYHFLWWNLCGFLRKFGGCSGLLLGLVRRYRCRMWAHKRRYRTLFMFTIETKK
jgi:hypothetical protein